VLEPNGTGIIESSSDLQLNATKSLRLADLDSSNYVALKAPDTVASNVTYTMPATGVTTDYFLQTDSSGNLSWAASFLSVSNQTADTNTYYPVITTSTTGKLTAVNTSSGNLSYQPSSGNLSSVRVTVTGNTASTTTATGAVVVTGGVGIGGQLTAATIVETSSITIKENISPIQNALDSIMKLSGVTYDRIDTKEHEAGLIAEWVDEVLPDMVTKDDNGSVVGIKYTKLIAYLIESVKSLKKEIETIKG